MADGPDPLIAGENANATAWWEGSLTRRSMYALSNAAPLSVLAELPYGGVGSHEEAGFPASMSTLFAVTTLAGVVTTALPLTTSSA